MRTFPVGGAMALALYGFLLGAAPSARAQASDTTPTPDHLQAPVLKCFRDYARHYTDTSALAADIATAAYAHCYDTLEQFERQSRAEPSRDLSGTINKEEAIATARSELEKRAHASALDEVLSSRYGRK